MGLMMSVFAVKVAEEIKEGFLFHQKPPLHSQACGQRNTLNSTDWNYGLRL